MADETTKVLLEHLRHIHSPLDVLRADVHGMRVRLTNFEEGLVLVNRRLDRVDERLDRIERRLDLVETPAGTSPMSRYKCWRSVRDKHLHVLCSEGTEAFEPLPASIRGLGPWQGSREGEVTDLRLPLRLLLAEQGFTVVHAHVSKLDLEARRIQSAVDNRACPDCNGTGNVAQHGGLRQKNCWRCGGRAWLPPKR